jgi:hypothetical protein
VTVAVFRAERTAIHAAVGLVERAFEVLEIEKLAATAESGQGESSEIVEGVALDSEESSSLAAADFDYKHHVAFVAVELDCSQIVVSRAADFDCRKIVALVAADLARDCKQLEVSVAADLDLDCKQLAAVAVGLSDMDTVGLAVAAGVACKDPAGMAYVDDAGSGIEEADLACAAAVAAGSGIEVADLACAAAVADMALAETKLDVEEHAATAAAGPAVESAADAQAGQAEDKLPGQVAPGVLPAQLGQTASQAVKPLVPVLEPAQWSLVEDPQVRGVLPPQQRASRTGSHSSPGSSSTVSRRQSALSRARGASGHQGQTEGRTHPQRPQPPPEPPCPARGALFSPLLPMPADLCSDHDGISQIERRNRRVREWGSKRDASGASSARREQRAGEQDKTLAAAGWGRREVGTGKNRLRSHAIFFPFFLSLD